MRNVFIEKSYTKCGGKTISRLFSKKIKIELNSGSIVQGFTQFIFNVCQIVGYRNIFKLSYRPLAFTSYKAFFKKDKKRPGTSLLALFSA